MYKLNQKGLAPIIIVVLIAILAGGVIIASKVIKIPSKGSENNQSTEQNATNSAANSTVKTSLTPTATQPAQNTRTTGTLEATLSSPEDAVMPLIRLFDDQLRMVYEDDGSKQERYIRNVGAYKYVLKNLKPGKYLVGAAGNFYFKPQNITIQAGKTTNITLSLNSASKEITTTLKGRTFVDGNGNKQYDSGEINVSGVVDIGIYLLTKDGEKRVYGFGGLPGGAYDLGGTGQHFLGKYIFKSGTQPGFVPVNLEMEMGLYNVSNTVNMPFTTQSTYSNPSTIQGRVYVDNNRNSQYDGGEPKPNDYFPSVALEKPGGQFRYDTITTNSEGEYSFSNLSPGTYVVKVMDVPNYSSIQSEATVSLGSGENKTINFGMLQR